MVWGMGRGGRLGVGGEEWGASRRVLEILPRGLTGDGLNYVTASALKQESCSSSRDL